MPRGLNNWTYTDVVDFLKAHGFTLHHTRGSHYYYVGTQGGELRMTHVQYHGKAAIKSGTMAAIVRQSGIPKATWLKG